MESCGDLANNVPHCAHAHAPVCVMPVVTLMGKQCVQQFCLLLSMKSFDLAALFIYFFKKPPCLL